MFAEATSSCFATARRIAIRRTTDPLNHDNIAKQRLLSENGREIAKQVGSSFKKLGIPLGSVYTSKLNRAVETGKLISGRDVTPIYAANYG